MEGTGASTIAGILEMAGSLSSWIITQMSAWLSWIIDNPIVLILFLVTVAGWGVSFLLRIWNSV